MKNWLIQKLIAIPALALTLSFLTACSGEILSPMPQKVTIEKPAESTTPTGTESSVSGSSSATETPIPTPTNAPIEQAPLNSVGIDDGADAVGMTSQKRAQVVEAANDRLDHGYYSRASLINGLISDGFTQEEAEYGADHCYIEWN